MSSDDPDLLVDVRGVAKSYRVYSRPQDRLKQYLSPGRQYYRDFWALKDVSLQLRRGETVGIIGRNGSGKSTLLQIICGTNQPTEGEVRVRGRVSALLELGAGFNPEYTGRENVRLYASVLGLSPAEIVERMPQIIEFAEIGEFLDMPVKTYSSGMFVRLAFSVAINVDPDVLVVDEALAVGDGRFQHRCMARIRAMQESGVAILYVSHDTEGVKRLCNEVLVLQDGRVVRRGKPLEVSNWYVALMTVGYDLDRLSQLEAERAAPADDGTTLAPREGAAASIGADLPEFGYFRHGDGTAEIVHASLCDAHGVQTTSVALGGEAGIEFDVRFGIDQPEYVVGFYITDRLGTHVIGLNSYQEKMTFPPAKAGELLRFSFRIPVELRPGFYSLSVSIAYNQFDAVWMDHIDNVVIFRVVDPDPARTVFGAYLPGRREVSMRRLAAAGEERATAVPTAEPGMR
ncbi:ABC transporter ATP-binding protein [Phenylobacterium sp. LjRoot225]|uniref:ABC transporter ATP-binding protein n=1 Tax=Phenylobacterium sp. LjRoot225 TaxID=3342285 RepID=UPI003ECC6BC2